MSRGSAHWANSLNTYTSSISVRPNLIVLSPLSSRRPKSESAEAPQAGSGKEAKPGRVRQVRRGMTRMLASGIGIFESRCYCNRLTKTVLLSLQNSRAWFANVFRMTGRLTCGSLGIGPMVSVFQALRDCWRYILGFNALGHLVA